MFLSAIIPNDIAIFYKRADKTLYILSRERRSKLNLCFLRIPKRL